MKPMALSPKQGFTLAEKKKKYIQKSIWEMLEIS